MALRLPESPGAVYSYQYNKQQKVILLVTMFASVQTKDFPVIAAHLWNMWITESFTF